MKKQAGGLLFSILALSFASAAYYGGSGFSFSEFLYSANLSDWILGIVFIISFALINFALNRTVLRENRTTSAVIALALALGITLAVNLSGVDLTNILFGIGISEATLYTVVPVILLIGFVLFAWKFGIPLILSITGAIFVLIGAFTDFFYEAATAITIGFVMIAIATVWWLFKHRRHR